MRKILLVSLILTLGCGREYKSPVESPDEAPPKIPKAGLIAQYTFDGDALDSSGSGNHGTLYGATAESVLVIGNNAIDRMVIPAAVLNGAGDFSISAWVKILTFHLESAEWSLNVLASGAIASDDNSFYFAYDGIRKKWNVTLEAKTYYFLEDKIVFDNKWHHILVIRSGSLATIWQDGIQIGSGLALPNSLLKIDEGGLVIGQEQDKVGGSFDVRQCLAGELDNLRFYRRALSPSEVSILARESR